MTPYYTDPAVTLYCADYRDVLPSLSKFDAIITDPPYAETSLDWDVWPKGWPAAVASLAPQLWCFGSMRMFWEQRDEFADWKLAQDIVWEKHNGSGMTADRFRRVHECALHFTRGDWSDLFKKVPIVQVEENRPHFTLKRGEKPAHWGGIERGTGYEYNGERLQKSVIPVRSCHGYAVNETQKPEGIVAPLVEYSVPPGGVMLDLFAGSGTTLAVARAQGKRAVGIEKRESQCVEIVKRLAQLDLFTVSG